MPVFGTDGMERALASLRAQTVTDWELVVVDDGSPDAVEVADALVLRHAENRGLGAALNTGLDHAAGDVVAYLPVDDVWPPDHLATLLGDPPPAGPGDRLAAVAHPRTQARWPERDEIETDDMVGAWCEDGDSPLSLNPACRSEPGARTAALRPSRDGGPATFRRRYRVRGPLRIHADGHELVDERRRYAPFADAPPPAPGGLRVLLAGELAYNPERILALEARGVTMSGLWIDDPLGFMTVGPLPFGHVRDVELDTWRDARPDVVYALLNWRAVPLAHRLLGQGVPLVFHFKEAPQRSIERGEWPLLAEVVERADAVVLSSPEERDWFVAALPGRLDPERLHVMDGDLPKREWLDAQPAAEHDPLRTVLLGRPYGFSAELLDGLAARGIAVEPRTDVEPADWVSELSRYGAGWLHPGEPSEWDVLNLPARIPTLVAAGLPLIVPKPPPGAIHAAARLASELGCGVLYSDLDDLAAQLEDLTTKRAAAWAAREQLTFDHHADRLLAILEAAASTRA